MTEPDETDQQIGRVLRARADGVDVPPGLAGSSRRRAVRRRGAAAGIAAAVLVAGVSVTSVALGGSGNRADGPAAPGVSVVKVCSGDTSGPDATREQLRPSSADRVVVCRTWQATSLPGAAAPPGPTAAELSANDAEALLALIADAEPVDPCAFTGAISHSIDRVVVDPGPDQRTITLGPSPCTFVLDGETVRLTPGVTALLQRAQRNAEPLPTPEPAAVCDATVAAPAKRSQVLAADPDSVVVCRFDNHPAGNGSPSDHGPRTLEASALLDRTDAERLLDLVASGQPSRTPCMMIDSIPAQSDVVVLDANGVQRTVQLDSPSCLGYRLGGRTLQSPEAQGLIGQLLATAAASDVEREGDGAADAAADCDDGPVNGDGPAPTQPMFDTLAGSVLVCHEPGRVDGPRWARTLTPEEGVALFAAIGDGVGAPGCKGVPAAAANHIHFRTEGDDNVYEVVIEEPGCLFYAVGDTFVAQSPELRALVAAWSEDPFGQGAVSWDSADRPAG